MSRGGRPDRPERPKPSTSRQIVAAMRPEDDAKMVAAVDLLGRTGAEEFQVRYSDDEKPLVWIAAARWSDQWEVAAAMNPLLAVFRLCDEVIDGGQCQHCGRPTGFAVELDAMPLADHVCWYQYDPELRTFRRGCADGSPS